MQSFMNRNFPNYNAHSSFSFWFKHFPFKNYACFACFLSFYLTVTFSVSFIWWQVWISSGLMVMQISNSAQKMLCSSQPFTTDRGTGLTFNISLIIYWVYWTLFRAFPSRLMIQFSSKKLQLLETNNSICKISF